MERMIHRLAERIWHELNHPYATIIAVATIINIITINTIDYDNTHTSSNTNTKTNINTNKFFDHTAAMAVILERLIRSLWTVPP